MYSARVNLSLNHDMNPIDGEIGAVESLQHLKEMEKSKGPERSIDRVISGGGRILGDRLKKGRGQSREYYQIKKNTKITIQVEG